jgi:hypothetical protein
LTTVLDYDIDFKTVVQNVLTYNVQSTKQIVKELTYIVGLIWTEVIPLVSTLTLEREFISSIELTSSTVSTITLEIVKESVIVMETTTESDVTVNIPLESLIVIDQLLTSTVITEDDQESTI